MTDANASLQFENLPLIEAVVRVYFRERIQIDYALVSSLHKPLKTNFPSVVRPSVFDVSPALSAASQLPIQPTDLPGAEFGGGTEGLSVHLQPQLLAVRWRHGYSAHDPTYPRYQRLRDTLASALECLRGASGVGNIDAAVTNMEYTNFIRVTDPRPFLRDTYSTGAIAAATNLQEFVVAWQDENGVDLRYKVLGAERLSGESRTPGYLLTTVAGLRIDRNADGLDPLDTVHGELQTLFSKLISDRAKKEWGFRNGSVETEA